jgi:hypothetical protein
MRLSFRQWMTAGSSWSAMRSLVAAGALGASLPLAASAQIIRGTVASSVGGQRVAGAVVLLLDSALTAHARALTSDSGTFAIGAGGSGRFYLRVMHIGFQPTESPVFDLSRDTTVALALTDIPIVLPALAIRDRNDCRLHGDTTAAGAATFALWDQARTALFAAAITLEERDYRFIKLLHVRVYDTKRHELRDVGLRDTETQGTAPWVSLPAERLRRDGYVTEDDSGMTFYAPDLDVLLSPYFTEEHCFHLTSGRAPAGMAAAIGLDFEPASRPRRVEIRGTLWLDSATKELQSLGFTFVNLPISLSPLDTLLGGRLEFERLATGAWILPSWSIRMPTPVRRRSAFSIVRGLEGVPVGSGRAHWRLTTDFIRVTGGDLRAVRRGDSTGTVIWRRPTGTARIYAAAAPDVGAGPAVGALVRLTGSPFSGHADIGGHVRFEQVLPGAYLFDVTSELHDAVEAAPTQAFVTVRAGEVAEGRAALEPLAEAVAKACGIRALDRNTAVLAGHIASADSVPAYKARVTVEWTGGEGHADTRDDGWFRICGVPTNALLLIKASAANELATSALTLEPKELVHVLTLRMTR